PERALHRHHPRLIHLVAHDQPDSGLLHAATLYASRPDTGLVRYRLTLQEASPRARPSARSRRIVWTRASSRRACPIRAGFFAIAIETWNRRLKTSSRSSRAR